MPNRFTRGRGLFGSIGLPSLAALVYGAAGITPNATAGLIVSERLSLTETTGAGVYTATVNVPSGALILDIKLWSTVLWTAATSATGKIGDVATDNGWFTGINLKATDLLVGEEINFIQTGGKEGTYLSLSTGARSAAYGAARAVSCIVTTVGASGSAGRSFFEVIYSLPPIATAAGKV